MDPKVTKKDIDGLLDWFVKHGGSVHPSVRFSQDSAGGISAFATEDIPEPPPGGTQICACPPELQLSSIQAPKSLHGFLPEHVLSNIALVQEVLREESHWDPYLKCLPKASQLTTPIYFKEEKNEDALLERRNDTAWLLGTNLGQAWREREFQWKREFDHSRRVMEQRGVSIAGYSWELFKWAGTIFTSRCFPSDPGTNKEHRQARVLMPVVDLLNHKFPTKVNWFFDRGTFQLNSEEPLVQGQEIFNNYGGKGNEELLNGYGFCIPNNPCDAVAIRFGRLPPPVVQEIERLLGEWDSSKVHYLRGRSFYGGLYPVSLAHHPKVTETESGIPQAIWTVFEVIKRFEDGQSALMRGRPLWRKLVSARCALLQNLSTKYNEIDKYNKYLPPEPLNDKQRYAKMYRDGQMTILRENVEQLQDLLLRENFITLEEALQALRAERDELEHSWEVLARDAFGTKIPRKIREAGFETEAWMLWLCAAWICADDDAKSNPSRPSRIRVWIDELLESHPYDSDRLIASQPFDGVHAMCERHPIFQQFNSRWDVWADERVSLTMMEWASRTAEAEARMLSLRPHHEKAWKKMICMKEI
ncbi:hypothetical protein IWX49DRAFT_558308 [Phyllosticta citricarpa]